MVFRTKQVVFNSNCLSYRSRRHKDIDPWVIPPADIEALGKGYSTKTLSVSRSRLFKFSEAFSPSMQSAKRGKVVKWKGRFAWSKQYHILYENNQFTKFQRKMLLARLRMQHTNIAWFYGFVVKQLDLDVISEYARKRSLEDVLDKSTIALNTELTNSFVKGIVEGMCYIHTSVVGFHGKLKPSNCLVDQRLTIRISDFGLQPILDYTKFRAGRRGTAMSGTTSGQHEADNSRNLLYLPPEVLVNPNCGGSQKADVYAFGIMLHQLLFRCGPFWVGNDKWQPAVLEHVEKIKKNSIDRHRPMLPVIHSIEPTFLAIMQECWANSADDRPGFFHVRQRLSFIRGFDTERSLVDSIMQRLEAFAKKLEIDVLIKTKEYEAEKEKTDIILCQIYPRPIVGKLQRGIDVPPEIFEEVTVCFTSISDFSIIVVHDSPFSVVAYLNDGFTMLDRIIEQYEVYKVETIGDSYLVVSGLPERNGVLHVSEIAKMSLVMIGESKVITFRGNRFGQLQLKIGIATGERHTAAVRLTT